MTNILCFVSSKGGSGKTVTSSALGTFLASLGFRVLLIDTDAATNGMTLLYLEQLLGRRRDRATPGTNVGLFEASDGMIPNRIDISENLHLIPATYRMTNTEETSHAQFVETLRSLLSDVSGYDFVFLDAQAGIDLFAKSAAALAERCVIVSEYDPVSAQGIERLKVLFANVIDPTATWTLFNKVLPEFAKVIGEGLAIARYLSPIPWDADVVRAFARRDLAITSEPPNPYTLAIAQIAYDLFPDESGDAIEKWRASALEAATSPVEARLSELEANKSELEKMYAIRLAIFTGLQALLSAVGIVAMVWLGFSYFKGRIGDETIWTQAIAIGVGVLGMAIAGVLPLFQGALKQMRKPEKLTLERIEAELQTLEAMQQSAEATLKLNRTAGYYERRRRRPDHDGSISETRTNS